MPQKVLRVLPGGHRVHGLLQVLRVQEPAGKRRALPLGVAAARACSRCSELLAWSPVHPWRRPSDFCFVRGKAGSLCAVAVGGWAGMGEEWFKPPDCRRIEGAPDLRA
jgi:hypothetical protein